MRRIPFLFSVAALACGSVADKQACSVSTDCPVGQFCASAGGQSRCWPDAVAPTVSGVSASCAAPCLRDGVVHVQATVADDNEVLDASVSLDLDPARTFPMTRSGPVWVADVPLRVLPFDAFTQVVAPTVVARDGARNPSAAASGAGVAVTRLKWSYNAAAPLTAPAVMSDGTVVVGVSAGTDQLLAIDASGTKAWSQTVGGTSFVTAAPAVGQHAIWVGSEDGNLYAIALDGTAVIAGVGANLGGPVKSSVAIRADATKDRAFATCKFADNTGRIGGATSASESSVATAPDGFASGPIIGQDERIHAPTANGTNDATLRTFTLDAPFVLSASWTAAVGKGSPAPLAMNASDDVVGASDEATPQVKKTAPGPTPTVDVVGDLAAFARDSAIVLANGDVVVGDENGIIHRFAVGGPVWVPAPSLGSAVAGPVALSGTTAPFIVPTNGKVYALADDGTTRWQAALPSATQLRAGNIFTPPSQPAGPVMSVAYFSSGNGHLYAVIVDGQLDASAPWPKAFHDPRNTNHAGPQP